MDRLRFLALASVVAIAAGCGGKSTGGNGPVGGTSSGPSGSPPGGVSSGPSGTGGGGGGSSSGPTSTGNGGSGGGSAGGGGSGGSGAGSSGPVGGTSSGPIFVPVGGAAPDPGILTGGGGGGGFSTNAVGPDCDNLLSRSNANGYGCSQAEFAALNLYVQATYLAPTCGQVCLRDTYVAAAILTCWAAKCTTVAADVPVYLSCVTGDLCNTNSLCSNSPGFCADPCKTDSIWTCDTTSGIGEPTNPPTDVANCPSCAAAIHSAPSWLTRGIDLRPFRL